MLSTRETPAQTIYCCGVNPISTHPALVSPVTGMLHLGGKASAIMCASPCTPGSAGACSLSRLRCVRCGVVSFQGWWRLGQRGQGGRPSPPIAPSTAETLPGCCHGPLTCCARFTHPLNLCRRSLRQLRVDRMCNDPISTCSKLLHTSIAASHHLLSLEHRGTSSWLIRALASGKSHQLQSLTKYLRSAFKLSVTSAGEPTAVAMVEILIFAGYVNLMQIPLVPCRDAVPYAASTFIVSTRQTFRLPEISTYNSTMEYNLYLSEDPLKVLTHRS